MLTVLKFTAASIKMFFRNKSGVFWTLFLPLLIMIIFGSMNFENYGKSNVAIVDKAETKETKQIISELKEVDIIKIEEMKEMPAKAKLKEGDLDLVIVIPATFSETLKDVVANQTAKAKEAEMLKQILEMQQYPQAQQSQVAPKEISVPKIEKTTITLYYNEGRKQQAMAGTTVLKEVFDGVSHKATAMPKLFNFKEEAVNAQNLTYIDFLVPGIVAMAIMQMGVFSIVFAIVQYRKKGIMKRLIATPMKSIDFIGGQVLTRIIVSLMQVAVILGVAVLAFDIKIIGNYFLIFLLVFLGALLFISLGFTMSSFASSEESAAPIANIVVFPMLFLSGVFFPVEAMPLWLQGISKYLPLTFLANALRSVMTEGAKITAIKTDILGLSVWSVIMIVLAMIFFRLSREE